MPGVQKQSVTNYMKGSSQPPLGVLIRLEMISGITISHFLTRILDIMEMPSHPIEAGKERQDQITLVRKELRALLEKIGGWLPKIANLEAFKYIRKSLTINFLKWEMWVV